jgi:hypothetical protein
MGFGRYGGPVSGGDCKLGHCMLECLRLSGSALGDAVVRTYVVEWGVLVPD